MKPSHILTAIVLLGCTEASRPSPFPTAPPELRQVANSAAARWYRATGLQPPGVAIGFGVCSQREHAAEYDDGWHEIIVCYGTEIEYYETALLHELGHAWGAPHGAQHRGVMRETIVPRMCLTWEDVELVCSVTPCLWMAAEC